MQGGIFIMAEWNFNINLAGVAPAGSSRPLPTGYYKGKIVDADGTVASTGRPQVAFKIEITDPEYAGITRSTWLGIPQAADDGVRYYWRAAFESAGYTPAQIEAGTISASPALFIGRDVYVHYQQGDKDAGQRDNLRFLPPAAWEQGKRAEGAINAGNGSALGGGAKVTTPNTGMGGGMGGMGGGMGATVQTPVGGGLGGAATGMGGGLGGGAAVKTGVAAADLLKALGAS
jgi:hypothetical protein